MSTRHLRLIAAALAALLVLWGASQLLSPGSDSLRGALAVPPLAAEQVTQVTIAHGSDTIDLMRTGARWTVNGHPAGPAALHDFLESLRDSSPPELAAASRSSWARLGVDSAGGWWMAIRGAGTDLLRLVIGRSGPGYESGYVRRPGSDTVYLWSGRLPELVRRPLEQWRDHRIMALEPDSVRAIEVAIGRTHYTLARGDSSRWRLRGGPVADSATVAALLDRLRNLQATGFATPAQADSSARHPPGRRLVVRGRDSTVAELSFDSTAAGWWVRRRGDSVVYRLDTWMVHGLTPGESAVNR